MAEAEKMRRGAMLSIPLRGEVDGFLHWADGLEEGIREGAANDNGEARNKVDSKGEAAGGL